jgi:NADPH2:quinone reductase
LCESQRVLGFQTQGGFAEYTVLPAANLIPLPDNADMHVLAAVPTAYATAWRMLATRARVEPNDWVLVHSAAGGVGTAAVQIARFLGAQVIGTVGSAAKLDVVRRIGANHVLDYHTDDAAELVADLTHGHGAQVVVDTVGSDTWQTSLACVGKNGRVVTCGVTSGPIAETNIRHLYQRQVSVMGSVLGGVAELRTVLNLTTLGALTPHIHKALPLSEIRRGHELLESREVVGKIVLDVYSPSPQRGRGPG